MSQGSGPRRASGRLGGLRRGRPDTKRGSLSSARGAPRKARFAAWHAIGARPSRVMVWTPVQTGAFLDAVAGERLYPLYHLIAYRGLRRGEACGLRWPDTDLDAAEIAILTQLVQNGWDVEEDSPKTEASDDTVTLDRETVAVLRAWRKAQLAERLAWGEAWGRDWARIHPGERPGLAPGQGDHRV